MHSSRWIVDPMARMQPRLREKGKPVRFKWTSPVHSLYKESGTGFFSKTQSPSLSKSHCSPFSLAFLEMVKNGGGRRRWIFIFFGELRGFQHGGRWATTVAPPHRKLLNPFFKNFYIKKTRLFILFLDPVLDFEKGTHTLLDLRFKSFGNFAQNLK